ncbi:MAG: lysophospholipid acyltransferase family protein [Phycisphaerales bacterium]
MKRAIPGWLQMPIYAAFRAAVASVGVAPPVEALRVAGKLGRAFGQARPNRARLERAMEHIAAARPAWSIDQRREYALRAYEHLFMLGVEMSIAERVVTRDGWPMRVEVGHLGDALRRLLGQRPVIFITGHVGNWEVLGFAMAQLGFPLCPLYRPLDLRPLDAWVRRTREAHGLHLVDKFGAVGELPALMARGGMPAFVADQNAGDRGLFVPFFGRLASTYKSIGLMAMSTGATIVCGMARRIGVGALGADGLDEAGNAVPLTPDPRWRPGDLTPPRYRIEVLDLIEPKDWTDQPDPLFYVTARYRRAIERMVALAPEQFLWMHRYWKSRPRHEHAGKPLPGVLREKLRALPWMTPEELDRVERAGVPGRAA